ncbi:MAG TPA: hypothetical protein VG326_01965 [Tepidisphaeraceae bacterium]|jgi:hypothetical protein|nr:hypothetical protein [Tepidisphaeraceae bacterium]
MNINLRLDGLTIASRRGRVAIVAALLLLAGIAAESLRAFSDDDPIHYSKTESHDPVAALADRVERGQARLVYDPQRGYLDSVLKLLQVPPSSQGLVFSRTSLQREHINPRKPRALYFNDDTYVGYVRGAPLLEFAAIDRNLGAVFYTLSQDQTAKPKFSRQNFQCLQCHETAATESVPGLLLRSVYPDMDGDPIQSGGSFITTDQSPLSERWGGWYVTGATGSQRHMGNTRFDDEDRPDQTDFASRANLLDLSRYLKTSPYPRDTSDAVALMVFAHQQRLHNLITSTNYFVRTCLFDADVQLKRPVAPPAKIRETTHARIDGACEILVKAILFCGECQLSDAIKGASGFAEEFSARGPRDSHGRSLRDLDLTHRLFKYQCSYLIYAEQFDSLPPEALSCIYRRLFEILTGKEASKTFGHIADNDRIAILQILRETKKDLPDYWKQN